MIQGVTLQLPEIIGGIVAVVGMAVGPGGVFYFLVKKGLNGSMEAVFRTEKKVEEIQKDLKKDHDSLTIAVEGLRMVVVKAEHLEMETTATRNEMIRLRTVLDLYHGRRSPHPQLKGEGNEG